MGDDNQTSNLQNKRSLDDILQKVQQRHQERVLENKQRTISEEVKKQEEINKNIPATSLEQTPADPGRVFQGVQRIQDPPTIYELSKNPANNSVQNTTPDASKGVKNFSVQDINPQKNHSVNSVAKNENGVLDLKDNEVQKPDSATPASSPSLTPTPQVDVQITYPIEVVEEVLADKI